MKKFLRGTALLIIVLLLGVAGLMAYGTSQLDAGLQLAAENLTVPNDAATIAEGERLVAIHQCIECHGENLGGTEFIASDAFMHLPAPNLTRGAGGLAGRLTPAEWEHAIRHGIGRGGRSLIVMPAKMLTMLTDADVAAIIAYAEHAPPVDNEPGERRYGPIGRVIAAIKADELLPARTIDHEAPHRAALDPGDTAALGRYLSQTCTECHQADLAGGPIAFVEGVYAPNLTPDPETGLASWSPADFTRVLREGVRPDGTSVDVNMPWRGYARLNDEEIAALWSYLTALPAIRRARE